MSLLATAAAGTAVLVAGAWWRARPAAVRNDGRTPCARGTAASPSAHATATAHEWAALLDSLAAEVRAGSALGTAWQQSLCRHSLRGRAVSPDHPLDETLRLDAGSRDEAVVLQVVGAAAAMGGPMALTIDAGASLLRERAAARADAIAHAAQARLSARVLTVVPVGFAAWSALTSGSFRTGIASAAGAASATIGAVLNGIGWWWMRSLVARAAP
ncbi:MAG: hypothetical protein ACO3S5_06750 [Ilumatobacteraceae bacterium]